jgi:hypothetical protein
MTVIIVEPFGPLYPDLATVKKHRAPLAAISREARQAYGLAVETAIRALQRSELQRATPAEPRSNSTSGTFHNNGAAIHKAMQTKQRAALLACPSQVRRAREPKVWEAMYAQAMAEKRDRETVALPLAA